MPPRWAARWLHAGRPDTSAGSRGAGEAPSPVTITKGAEVIAEFRGRSRVVAPSQPGSDGIRVLDSR